MERISWLTHTPWQVKAAGLLALLGLAAALVVVSWPSDVAASRTWNYYIAADEVEWDYAPGGNMVGDHLDEDAAVFLDNDYNRIGKVYRKALYREYTDNTFTTLKPRTAEWEHLGALGPVIRARVDDTIRVHFKNNASFAASVHPHGVFYDKDSEGSPYNDGTSGSDKQGDRVEPGDSHTYVWPVPERAGPGPADPSSIVWLYHSHVSTPLDTNTGLIGPMIISDRDRASAVDSVPRDVDREFVTLFTVFDENSSRLLDHNIETYAGIPGSVDPDDDDFAESNLMHGINGFLYSNVPGLDMEENERVRWYLLGMGTEVDMHTAHWHGNTVVWRGSHTDVVEVFPASMQVADMRPDNPGAWQFHCHINDHILGGMVSLFNVRP